MTGAEYCKLAGITNDGASNDRLKNVANNGTLMNYGEVVHACLGLTGEAGEVADMVKKHIFHNKEMDMVHFKKEIGDVMWYISLMCHGCGFDLDEIFQMNIDKLAARYPNGFNYHDANNRKEGDV